MVRTRFAPSPTGYLHIGGVRTALFNWLFAGGTAGSSCCGSTTPTPSATSRRRWRPILHGFRWLGIDWDEGPEVGGPHAPYYQSQRLAGYQTPSRNCWPRVGLSRLRHAGRNPGRARSGQAEKRPFLYSRRWMAETAAEQAAFAAEGRQAVVRLKMPREGKLVIDDLVRGRVEFDWAREQDHVIQRADGTCLYHLASVVDDFDFEITT